MAESSASRANIPWGPLLIVLLATSVPFLYFSPLKSARPQTGGGEAISGLGAQDVDARLWQDPFKAAMEAHRRVVARIAASRTPESSLAIKLNQLLNSEAATRPAIDASHGLTDLTAQIEQHAGISQARTMALAHDPGAHHERALFLIRLRVVTDAAPAALTRARSRGRRG